MIRIWTTWLLMLFLVAALGLGGCGGGDSAPSAAGNISTPAAVTALAITSRNSAGLEQSGSNVTVGDNALLQVTASGSGTLAYQWYRNGVAIEGATGASYSLAQITRDDDRASFTVKVSNAANPGGSLSSPLTLAVYARSGIDLFAGGLGGSGNIDGVGAAARFYQPEGLTIDASGNLYVADTYNHTIRKITPAGEVSTLAGSAGQVGSIDGSGNMARFSYPRRLAIDASRNLYVAQISNDAIRKITPVGEVSTLAVRGNSASIVVHEALTLDASGNLYVADSYNSTIHKITPTGVVSTLAGSAHEFGSADGSGSAARFSYPRALTIDASGNLYVADMWNNTIRKITPTGVVSTLAGSAGEYGSTDGSGSAARFHYPRGLTIDASGNLYVADSGNHTIRKVTPTGDVSTVAGVAGAEGVKLGALPGGLNSPVGVVYGKRYSGEALYVTTAENNVLTISLR